MRNRPGVVLSILLLLVFGASTLVSSAEAQLHPDSLLKDLRWRNIGPANMMGRISAVDAFPDDYRTVLIGPASGGVWKTTNAGNTVTPSFDSYGSLSIGHVKFFQEDSSTIWVGTGEDTNRNSVESGVGVYKSTNGGNTFKNIGLRNTYQIAEVVPHPTDSSIVYVAALVNLWNYKGRRGLFKSMDGGNTWEKLTNGLLPSGNTGQIDVDLYRKNLDILMAYVEADDDLPYDMSVPGPGIYRSDDGGQSWMYKLRHNSRPSYHDVGTAYVTFDNYRRGDFSPYVYKTTDFGQSWTSLSDEICIRTHVCSSHFQDQPDFQ